MDDGVECCGTFLEAMYVAMLLSWIFSLIIQL